MEGSSNEHGGGDSLANDWRSQLEPDLRERVIFAVVEKLKISFHQVSENIIKKTAIKFEDEMYDMAIDKDDYLRKMSREVLGFHRNFIIVSSDINGANTTPYPGVLQQYQPNNPVQPQNRVLHGPSSTSDWREETYQKIKALKEKHIHVLSTLFQSILDKLREVVSLPQQKKMMLQHERVENLRAGKANLEKVLLFLNVSRSNISEIHRDRFSQYEAHVLKYTNSYRAKQQQQVHLPPSQANQTSLQSQFGGSRDRLGEDLTERRTRLCLQEQEDTNPTKSFNRSFTKVKKIEPSYALLQEINEINGRLVETVVSICNEDVGPYEVTSGTIVTCSYVPLALNATFKALYESGRVSQIQPLSLLVPENYPCSPILVEKTLFDTASVHNDDLSGRARTRFSLSMKEYSEPMSLKEIAQVWDECARATIIEYAERYGMVDGTFSSKYGHWDSVLRSS